MVHTTTALVPNRNSGAVCQMATRSPPSPTITTMLITSTTARMAAANAQTSQRV
jgi:hypothetical protein